jgi:signal transduction histidine kinase
MANPTRDWASGRPSHRGTTGVVIAAWGNPFSLSTTIRLSCPAPEWALAARMPVPVEIGTPADRLPLAVEATAYFILAEALTNVAMHAHAFRAAVTARVENGMLQLQVRDDRIGGVRSDGSALLGIGDGLAG